MIPIDTEYDSATPEPGYEGLTITELFELIADQEREQAYYDMEQEAMWRDFPFHNSSNFGRY